MNTYIEIKISNIKTSKKVRDKNDLPRLVESIGATGMLHAPVVVRRNKTQYDLVAGRTRLEAAKKAGLTSITCRVFEGKLDDPKTRLAFIDENFARTELPSHVRDQMAAERRKLIETHWPELAPKARMRQGAAKGRQTQKEGRRAGQGGRRAGKYRSGQADEQAEYQASRRHNQATSVAWKLYSEGKLTQKQMDAIVTLPDSIQDEVAQACVGKSADETRALVRVAAAAHAAPSKRAKALIEALKGVDDLAHQYVSAAAYCTGLLQSHDGSWGGFGVTALALRLNNVLSTTESLIKEVSNVEKRERQQQLHAASAQG